MDFVDGKADPWGMKVNPSYKKIELPRPEWPLLDDYIPETENTCRQNNPAVYFTQLAAPVTTLRKIAEALLDGWPNVQTRCDFDLATNSYKLGRVDRQSFGARFMLGIVSLGDVERYGLRSAALETKSGYVAPTDESLGAAVALTTQKKTTSRSSWTRATSASPARPTPARWSSTRRPRPPTSPRRTRPRSPSSSGSRPPRARRPAPATASSPPASCRSQKTGVTAEAARRRPAGRRRRREADAGAHRGPDHDHAPDGWRHRRVGPDPARPHRGRARARPLRRRRRAPRRRSRRRPSRSRCPRPRP